MQSPSFHKRVVEKNTSEIKRVVWERGYPQLKGSLYSWPCLGTWLPPIEGFSLFVALSGNVVTPIEGFSLFVALSGNVVTPIEGFSLFVALSGNMVTPIEGFSFIHSPVVFLLGRWTSFGGQSSEKEAEYRLGN